MKRQLYTRLALGFVLGGSALGLSACDFDAAKEAFTNAKIVLGLEDQKTTVGVSFVDAASGQLISGDFQVNVTGPDATSVVDSYGDPLDKRTAKSGLISFAINNAKTPSASAPVSIKLNASPAGYLPVAQNVVLRDTGSVSLQVRVLRPTAPSQGTQAAQQSNTSSAAGTASAINASTSTTPPPSGGQAPPQASVSAPAGATLRDANNVALTGSVTTTIVSVDPTQAASVSLLPAGLNTGAFGKTAATSNVIVASGNLLVYVNGVAASTVSNGTLRLNIPPSVTVNPATGQAWAAGQTTLAYRYNVAAGGTGTWVQDGSFNVVAASGGGFALETTRASLSTGWWAGIVQVQNTETVTLTINRSGQTGSLTVALSQPGVSRTLTLTGTENSAIFNEVPTLTSGSSRTLTVLYGAGASASTTTSGTSATVSLTAPPAPVTVNITPKCPDPNKGIYFDTLPSIYVQASETGKNSYFALGDVTKQATITRATGSSKITKVTFVSTLLQVGKTYDLIGVYEGNTFGPETRAVTGTTMELTWDVDGGYCQ